MSPVEQRALAAPGDGARSGHRRWRFLAIAGGALAIAAAFYWGYSEHQKREVPKAVSAFVHDATLRLHEALHRETEVADESAAAAVRFDRHATVVDQHLRRLRAMDTATIEGFADAADDYLLASREILRRWAAHSRQHGQLVQSARTLRQHMRSDDRTGAWVSAAVRARERLDADYREYRLTAEALGNQLGLFHASRGRLMPYVGAALLAEERLLAAARSRVRETLAAMTREVATISQLHAYR